jgi:hypothetical protein
LDAIDEISALNLILEERDSELMAEREFSRGKEAEIAGHRSQIDLLKSRVERDVDSVASNSTLESRIEQQRVDALDSVGVIADLEQNVAEPDEEINSLRCDSIAKEKTVLVMEGRIEPLEPREQGTHEVLNTLSNDYRFWRIWLSSMTNYFLILSRKSLKQWETSKRCKKAYRKSYDDSLIF